MMTISSASKLISNIYTSRCPTYQEFIEFSQFNLLELSNFIIEKDKILKGDVKDIEFKNSWCLRFNDIETCDLYFNLTNKQEFFFIENLIFLIEKFFIPKSIFLNGIIKGYDDIFGMNLHFNIINNEIFIDSNKMELDDELDNLNEDIQNLSLN